MIYFLCKLLQHWFFRAAFYAADCLVWLQTHSLIEQGPSPHRRRWIMLKGSTPNYPKHLGATAETAIGVLINARPDPPAPPTKTPPPPPTTATTTPPGRFQDGGIWMCGCMCLWFHFVDVWLCCWQTSVAHASHAALERNSGKGGVGWWVHAEVPALIWFPCKAATGRCNHKPMKHTIS